MDAYTQAARDLLNLSAKTADTPEGEVFAELDLIVAKLTKISASHKEKSAKPWYIHSLDRIDVTSTQPMDITVAVHNSLTAESDTVCETLSPPFEDFEIDLIEEHGGEGCSQQSIVINITETDTEREACIQVEIDPETGRFQESSLNGWEIHKEGDEDGDD